MTGAWQPRAMGGNLAPCTPIVTSALQLLHHRPPYLGSRVLSHGNLQHGCWKEGGWAPLSPLCPWRCVHAGGRAVSGIGCPKERLRRAREGQPFMGWVGAFVAPGYPFATVRPSRGVPQRSRSGRGSSGVLPRLCSSTGLGLTLSGPRSSSASPAIRLDPLQPTKPPQALCDPPPS